MVSYINEFLKAEKPKDYYAELAADLKEINNRYHAFNVINEEAGKDTRGMPFSTKANICVKGYETTAGSKMLKGYEPPFSSTAAQRMIDDGRFSFIGVANMDEFGFGTFGINTEVPARNAFDSDYASGGSSSGSAVATALIKYHVAVAESTGGSISTPAAMNGVVGFTPTYGAVSRHGLIDYANSLDKIGVMARSSDDARIAFDCIRGKDDYDMTCAVEKINSNPKKKLYVVDELLAKTDHKVAVAFGKLLHGLEKDYKVEHISSALIEQTIAPYYIIAMAEASTNLAKYNGYKYGLLLNEFNKRYNEFFTDARGSFGTEAKRRIILGTFIRSESVREKYYSKALAIRAMLIKELSKLLNDGFMISPAIPISSIKIKEAEKLNPLQSYSMDLFTIPPNLGGFPHITFPYDYIDGMPLGAQLVSEQGNDYALLNFVKEWEQCFDYRYKYNLGSL